MQRPEHDFPLVYCNGDSYSNNLYNETLHESTYDFVVAKEFNGFNINNAVSGSCNRRIIRTSVADLLEQRKLNPNQRIIALIGLSFDLRSEFWNEGFLKPHPFQVSSSSSVFESDFYSHQFSEMLDWFGRLRQGKKINQIPANVGTNFTKKFFDILNNARAFFYSPYAERINLYCDLIMFKSLMDDLDIEFLVFNAAPPEPNMSSEATLDHFSRYIAMDNRFIGVTEGFNFCGYLASNNFVPLDFLNTPEIGHYGSDGHEYFAKNVLLPLLNTS